MGGAPVRVDGRLQLVEGPRFPPSFDQERVPVFNTNTAVFDLDALDLDHDLTWLYVEKEVEGRPAVQLERLYHEVSALVPTTYLEVPRAGAAWPVLPDQDAGRPRAVAGRPARARLLVAGLTGSAHTRHEDVTERGVASLSAPAERGPPRAVRRLSNTRLRALWCLPPVLRPSEPAALRTLRLAWRLARPTLRRVLGPKTRLRQRALGDRLRRARSGAGARVEGEWTQAARARGGRAPR